jgi:hypothetical protein
MDLKGTYGVDDYLADLQQVLPPPYAAVSVRDGARYFSQHPTIDALRTSISNGGVSATKLSRLWHRTCPQRWLWMRTLYGALCRRLMMIYLSPSRSEDVDLFLAGPDSALGAHFDSTDVFTVQLFGERRWEVDETFDAAAMAATMQDPDWSPAKEVCFSGRTNEIVLKPSDVYYVPAYCVHRVTGVSWSVSLSLGLRAFNEFDVLETLVEGLKVRSYTNHLPLDVYPESALESYTQAKLDMIRRVRELITCLEHATVGALLQPLTLPSDLDEGPEKGKPVDAAGGYRSGFALQSNDN